ncbi:MAG: hypothetical protein IJI45_01305 [Anaerolineaceae bacterium]|nr:hypothetical protein [Anaerolineaceae bacterium]
MRCLKRNQRFFWYALYNGETELTDSDGLYTGEIGPGYETPVQMKANISASKGTADTELFGEDLQYSRTIATDDMNCPITEESILWIERSPVDDNNEPVPHNYVVAGIAKSLNSLLIAIREVKVTETVPEPAQDPEPDPDDPNDPNNDG